MTRARRWTATVLALAVVPLAIGWVLVPAAPTRFARPADPIVWSGAYHVHTTRSDGSGSPDEVARAAARAGLQFVILTDHGDGTREPLAPAYLSGVLVIDGVEISTEAGHFVALGMPRAPYPLAGEARDVAEDVRRLGGIGIVAHPDSARRSLAWHDWETRGDGLEIFNADSAWRDESIPALLRLLPAYPWRPSAVLSTTLAYPADLLKRVDDPLGGSPRLALTAVDAHARIGLRPRDEPLETATTLARVPSYLASFGTFGLALPWHAPAGPSGAAAADAATVLDALRRGAVHNVVFTRAAAADLRFTATSENSVFEPGALIQDAKGISLRIEPTPVERATFRLLRNGTVWTEGPGDVPLVATVDDGGAAAVYRAEVWLPRRWRQPEIPWMVSQAIAVRTPAEPVATAAPSLPLASTTLAVTGPWRSEHDATSRVVVSAGATSRLDVHVTLGDGAPASQFAAAAADWPVSETPPQALVFTGQATAPMRVSVQVREPADAEGRRWVRSVYLDQEARRVHVPLDEMTPIWPATGAPPLDRLHAVLLVIDTVNANPGDARHFTIEGLALQSPQ